MKIGTVLLTKDGRRIGNAIILDRELDVFTNKYTYTIKTDFGNVLKVSKLAIKSMFYIDESFDGKERLLDWLESKAKLLWKGVL